MKTKQELIDKILKKNKQVRKLPIAETMVLMQLTEDDLKILIEVYDDMLIDIMIISSLMLKTNEGRKYVEKQNDKEIKTIIDYIQNM